MLIDILSDDLHTHTMSGSRKEKGNGEGKRKYIDAVGGPLG